MSVDLDTERPTNMKRLLISGETAVTPEDRLRQEIYDHYTSDQVVEIMLRKWHGLQHGFKEKVIDAALIAMLFPHLRDKLRLNQDDLRIIKTPPKQFMPTNSSMMDLPKDAINLAAAGRILFPQELKDWSLDNERYRVELERDITSSGDMTLSEDRLILLAVSERILHDELYPDEPKLPIYPDKLWERQNNDYAADSPFHSRTLIPGQVRLLFPDRPVIQPTLEDLKYLAGESLGLLASPVRHILFSLAIAAGDFTIDKNGAHFTPPGKKSDFREVLSPPEALKF